MAAYTEKTEQHGLARRINRLGNIITHFDFYRVTGRDSESTEVVKSSIKRFKDGNAEVIMKLNTGKILKVLITEV